MIRLLFVQPSCQPPGGGNGVAAWMLQAVKDPYDVTVLSQVPLDVEAMNRHYGTTLAQDDVRSIVVGRVVVAAIDRLPFPLALLKSSLLRRAARARADQFDGILTANNESSFGRPTLQYVHYPYADRPRPDTDLRWYHGAPGALRVYYALCDRLAAGRVTTIGENVTLVNSDWVGAKVRALYGTAGTTVYPPAAGVPEVRAWDARTDRFVCIGRLAPEKALDDVIDIVAAVRRAVPQVGLDLVGSGRGSPRRYIRHIRRRVAAEPWITLHEDVDRAELWRIVARSRYGIHGMKEEHFGMAPAELVSGGCIVFVPRGGGQVEIVARDDRLTYDTPADAVTKIVRLLRTPGDHASIRSRLADRARLWSADRFVAQIRAEVAAYLSR